MQDVIVVGDGEDGLGIAWFLLKNGLTVSLYGNEGAGNHAMLRCTLKVLGATVIGARVDRLSRQHGSFVAELDNGLTAQSRFVLISEGVPSHYADQLGLACLDEGEFLWVDINGMTSLDGVYAVGAKLVRTWGRPWAYTTSRANAPRDLLRRAKEHLLPTTGQL
ncbi:MAG: hypothetical protein ABW252_26590 [Polyangiales bacterium]